MHGFHWLVPLVPGTPMDFFSMKSPVATPVRNPSSSVPCLTRFFLFFFSEFSSTAPLSRHRALVAPLWLKTDTLEPIRFSELLATHNQNQLPVDTVAGSCVLAIKTRL